MGSKKYWWILIILVAVFWRFWSFETRWVLNQDQARDVIMAMYAIQNKIWPEIGSPSSAGPFNFGPWYHWLIMFWEKVTPNINGPWIGFGLMSVVSVILYYFTGGWMAGVMAAVAVGMVENSPDMLNTVIVGFSSALTWYGTKKLIDTEKWQWGAMVGIGVGLSINFHFQSLGLLAIPLAIILVNKFSLTKRVYWGMSMAGGLLMTFIPIIIFDIKRNGVWINSVIEYYTVGVNKFYVPVRWLTEIRDFWPQLFGSVTVGINNFGYVWICLGAILIIKKIKISKFEWILMVTLLIEVLLMRNYKGVRSREYMIAFHGMIVLICSQIVLEYYKLNKYVGLIILSTVVILAGIKNWQNIVLNRSQSKDILEIKKTIDEKYVGKFKFEQYKESDMVSLPIFYLYYRENRIDNAATKISFCDGNKYACPKGETISKNKYNIYIDNKENWDELTAKNIYDRLMVNYGKSKE